MNFESRFAPMPTASSTLAERIAASDEAVRFNEGFVSRCTALPAATRAEWSAYVQRWQAFRASPAPTEAELANFDAERQRLNRALSVCVTRTDRTVENAIYGGAFLAMLAAPIGLLFLLRAMTKGGRR